MARAFRRVAVLTGAFVAFAGVAHGAPSIAWIATAGGNASDLGAHAVAARVDGSGNTYVTGSRASLRSDPAASDGDFLTIKYDAQGHELWRAVANGLANGNDTPAAMALASDGGVVVTGAANGTNRTEFLTVKYSSGGAEQWRAQPAVASGDDQGARAVATDAQGNVVVAGVLIGPSSYAGRVILYGAAGEERWRIDVPNVGATAIAIDAAGSCQAASGETGAIVDARHCSTPTGRA